MRGKKILVGVSGSIAAYKACDLVRRLMERGASVEVAMTPAAQRFVQPLTFAALTQAPVFSDLFEPRPKIAHVETSHAIHALVIAPASADLLAKLACGLADDPVSATALATAAPLLIAPAMETGMWQNAATRANVATLRARGARFVGPEEGVLASGRMGVGRLAEVETIVVALEALFARGNDLRSVPLVITAGPTIEPIDPVRVLSNRSSGAMGIALAKAAASRGAEVDLILGPTHLPAPSGVRTHRVETAQDMLASGLLHIDRAEVLIGAAAVSDFRPKAPLADKLKRSSPQAHILELAENPDVLSTLTARLRTRQSPRAIVVGFAAETEAVLENARRKLAQKGCDLLVANRVGKNVGFGSGETEVTVLEAGGEELTFGPACKDDVAEFVLDQVVRLRGQLSSR